MTGVAQPPGLSSSLRHEDILALLALTLIWGSSFALIKLAVEDIPPLSLAAGRMVLAAMVLLAVQAAVGPPLTALLLHPLRSRWRQLLVLGMLGNGIPFVLIGYGETRIGSGLAAILIGAMPILTLLLAHLFAVERGLSHRVWAGVGLGFIGLMVLIGPAAMSDPRDGAGFELAAQLAVVLGGASYAATAVYGRVLSRDLPVAVVTSGSMTASALVMAPLALAIDRPWQLSPAIGAWLAMAALGIGATAIASLIYFRLLRSAGPTFASLVNYVIPGFGFLLGVVWLGEPATWREIAALALILAAIGLVRAKPTVAPAPPNT